MSNNIYDILGKLSGLAPKENPISTSETIYESIDPQGDIMSAVNLLEDQYVAFKEAKEKDDDKRETPQDDVSLNDLRKSADPDVVRLATKAKFKKPHLDDFEAIVSYVNKQEQELERAEQAEKDDRAKIEQTQQLLAQNQANQDALRKVIDATDQRFRALNAKVASGQITAQDQAAARAAQEIERDADVAKAAIEKEKPTSASNISINVPGSTAATTAPAQQPTSAPAVSAPATTQAGQQIEKGGPVNKSAGVEDEVAKQRIKKAAADAAKKKADKPEVDPFKFASLEEDTMNLKIKLREYKEGDPPLGIINYNQALKAFQNVQEKTTLDFGNGKMLPLYDYQLYGLLVELGRDQNQERKVARIEEIMSSYDKIVQLLMTPRVKKAIAEFPEFAARNPKFKARKRDVEQNKFRLEPSPAVDPSVPVDPTTGKAPQQPHPYQQSDSQLEENLGNNKMKNPNSIIEAVNYVEEGKKLKDKKQFDAVAEPGDYYLTDKGNKVIKTKSGIKHEKVHAGDKEDDDDLEESAKPDFLDLDKDGDTKEPMKKAAKDAKELDEVSKKTLGSYVKKASADIAKREVRIDRAMDPSGSNLNEPGMQKALNKNVKRVAGLSKATDKLSQVDEVAPPGAKAERMVKHIKKGYAKDGKLTKREKGIAYATAWKAHNKGKMEEGTEFGDTIKNSEAKMTKVKVAEGKEAIRNHPIYTTKEAWDHYAQELAEQEAMETPVVDAVQELDEIARLAGLPARMESKCSSCGCKDCKCGTLDEAMSRKDYRAMANDIANMENREDAERLARKFSAIAKNDNPRFKEDMFLAACGIDVDECGMASPATVLVGEESVDEGNEFTKARLDAIAAGKDSFTVGGKTYKVSGDTSDEKAQVESVDDEKQAVTEDINISVSANGEEDVVNLIRKLSGMPVVAIQAPQVAEEYCDACDSTECHCEAVSEERDVEYANTPDEQTAPVSAAIPSGTDLNRSKVQDPATANKAANPLEEEKVDESLWQAYEALISDLKV